MPLVLEEIPGAVRTHIRLLHTEAFLAGEATVLHPLSSEHSLDASLADEEALRAALERSLEHCYVFHCDVLLTEPTWQSISDYFLTAAIICHDELERRARNEAA